MLNATVGFQRVIGRLRRSSSEESMSEMLVPTRLRVARRTPSTSSSSSIHLYPRSRRRRRTLAMPTLTSLTAVRKLSVRRLVSGLGHERTVAIGLPIRGKG